MTPTPQSQELRTRRLAAGYTQDQAAGTVGVSTRHYRRLETGDRPIPKYVLTLSRLFFPSPTL